MLDSKLGLFLQQVKTKIAYYCSSKSWGGLEMNHLRDAQWMKERGHAISVFAVKNSPFSEKCIDAGLTVIDIEAQKKYYDFKKAGILTHRLQEMEIKHLVIRSTRDMSIAATVKSKLKDKITTVYIQARQLGVKKKNVLHTARFKYIDIWVTPLESLAKQVRDWTNFKNNLVVIPSGLDLQKLRSNKSKQEARKELNLPEETLLLGLIGRFDPQKGQLLLLEAISKSEHDNYDIVLLGEPTKNEGDEYYQLMNDKIKGSNLKNRVHVRPFMPDPSVFYKAIDWLVMATKAETFGMVTIESIACGTPVIGSNAGGTPELLDNETAGILFESMNADSLALKIDEIIDKNLQFEQSELMKKGEVYDHNRICNSFERAIGIA